MPLDSQVSSPSLFLAIDGYHTANIPIWDLEVRKFQSSSVSEDLLTSLPPLSFLNPQELCPPISHWTVFCAYKSTSEMVVTPMCHCSKRVVLNPYTLLSRFIL